MKSMQNLIKVKCPLSGPEMNRFLNENWDEVMKELGPGIGRTLAAVNNSVFKAFFEIVPFNQIFTDWFSLFIIAIKLHSYYFYKTIFFYSIKVVEFRCTARSRCNRRRWHRGSIVTLSQCRYRFRPSHPPNCRSTLDWFVYLRGKTI